MGQYDCGNSTQSNCNCTIRRNFSSVHDLDDGPCGDRSCSETSESPNISHGIQCWRFKDNRNNRRKNHRRNGEFDYSHHRYRTQFFGCNTRLRRGIWCRPPRKNELQKNKTKSSKTKCNHPVCKCAMSTHHFFDAFDRTKLHKRRLEPSGANANPR